MSFQERILAYLRGGVRSGELSEEEYLEVMEALERAGKITTTHPELYKGLLESSLERLPDLAKKVKAHRDDMRRALSGAGLETFQADINENMMKVEAIGSDASSNPMPVTAAYVALVGGIAIRDPRRTSPIIARDILIEDSDSMGHRSFKFYYQVYAEKLIPITCIKQIKDNGAAEVLVVDGPLSASILLRRVPKGRGVTQKAYQKIQKAAHELIRLRDDLIKLCKEKGIILISVVKRCTSRHFLAWYDLKEKIPYRDQYVFHQILRYGERTTSISISKAIEKQGAPPFGRYCEIRGFYIKTSKSPLTPPLRVEYPEYLEGKEDWIASYVLSTAITSAEAEYDGLPKAQCLAHKDARIAGMIMREIYKRSIIKLLDEGLDPALLGCKWGFGLGD